MIIHGAWLTGEPGTFFIDRANEYNPVPKLGSYEATGVFLLARQYLEQTPNRLEEEKMAVIVQRVVGRAHGERFYPDQRMTRMEALRSYTSANAYAAFEEDLKGTLTVGKLGDVTVLSRDILEIPEEEIPGTEVDFTIVGGEIRFRR